MGADYHLVPLFQPNTDDYTTSPEFLSFVIEIVVVEVDSRHFVNHQNTPLQPLLQGSCGASISIVCSCIMR